jgi:hypothetical protein
LVRKDAPDLHRLRDAVLGLSPHLIHHDDYPLCADGGDGP